MKAAGLDDSGRRVGGDVPDTVPTIGELDAIDDEALHVISDFEPGDGRPGAA
ncbi:hypothetical protein [Streptomyces sp. bgisy027]|uniref:hypothetical protein n=1 Tax=Streptomyces sp. bgisy027 TaxID=3413770 RepID=UPI003D7257B4